MTRWLALALFFGAAPASAQPPCVDAALAEWNVEAAGCRHAGASEYTCADGLQIDIVVTATRGMVDPSCASLPTIHGGLAGEPTACDVVNGIVYLQIRDRAVALRPHPESHRLVMVYAMASRAQIRRAVEALVPLLGVAVSPACTESPDDLGIPLVLTIPRGAWTTRQYDADHTAFVIVDPAVEGTWLSMSQESDGCEGAGDRTLRIDGQELATGARDGPLEACVWLDTNTQEAAVRVRGSASAVAFAALVLRDARPAAGWTLEAPDPYLDAPWIAAIAVMVSAVVIIVVRRR